MFVIDISFNLTTCENSNPDILIGNIVLLVEDSSTYRTFSSMSIGQFESSYQGE